MLGNKDEIVWYWTLPLFSIKEKHIGVPSAWKNKTNTM
jgi:hypothetical protein